MAYLNAPGQLCTPEDLALPKSRAILELLSRHPSFMHFIECRRDDGREYIVLGLDVEIPQDRKADIREHERVSIGFDTRDERYPDILALRDDFPLDLSHTNVQAHDRPVSLCLFNEPYHDIRRYLTAFDLVQRIGIWFTRTARGELHEAGQALEPFILSAGTVILPPDVREIVRSNILHFGYRSKETKELVLIPLNGLLEPADEHRFLSVYLTLPPTTHGKINRTPLTIGDLHRLVSERMNYDLVAHLREAITNWCAQVTVPRASASSLAVPVKYAQQQQNIQQAAEAQKQALLNCHLLIILDLPRLREEGGEIERQELYAFLAPHSLRDIGVGIDGLHIVDGTVFPFTSLASADSRAQGDQITVSPVSVVTYLDNTKAASYAGYEPSAMRVVLVGCGALGSQLYHHLVCTGWGKWVLIDNDSVLPHNPVRHKLGGAWIGDAKAQALAHEAMLLFQNAEYSSAIVTDFLAPQTHAEQVRAALQDADLIIDCSTSIAVERVLADGSENGRRASLFLNPVGSDLVLLLEDTRRECRLDELEMQYLRTVATHAELHEHLAATGRIRYGGSCRDLSQIMRPHLVSLHAAVGAEFFHNMSSDSAIRIWRHSAQTNTVSCVEVPVHSSRRLQIGEWTLVIDQHTVNLLSRLRVEKLPNETGGVLLGSIDLNRHCIYLADVLASPSDSQEWPQSYIRGCSGLRERCEKVEQATLHELQYLGEWHSHPDGHSTAMSSADRSFLQWLRDNLDITGRPPVLLIAGESGFSVYLADNHVAVDWGVGHNSNG